MSGFEAAAVLAGIPVISGGFAVSMVLFGLVGAWIRMTIWNWFAVPYLHYIAHAVAADVCDWSVYFSFQNILPWPQGRVLFVWRVVRRLLRSTWRIPCSRPVLLHSPLVVDWEVGGKYEACDRGCPDGFGIYQAFDV